VCLFLENLTRTLDVEKAYWDSLVDGLQLVVPCYVRVLSVLNEIRSGINMLGGSRDCILINDVLDMSLIKQQIDTKAFDWNACKSLLKSVLHVIVHVQVFFTSFNHLVHLSYHHLMYSVLHAKRN